MIEAIKLKNFQCHKNLVIRFTQPVTTIVGSSDIGKSAILRALRWVCLNRPAGVSFVRHGESKCQVQIKVDGHTITRKTEPREYRIDKQRFRAFRGDVPEEIQSLLNVDEHNFQKQHDAPFWFSETPGQLSKLLNAIVNLETIDKAIAASSRLVRKKKTELEIHEEQLEQAKEELKKLAWVEEVDKKLEWVEEKEKQREEQTDKLNRLNDVLDRFKTHRQRVRNLDSILKKGKVLLALIDQYEETRKQLEKLNTLISSITKSKNIASINLPDTNTLDEMVEMLGQRKRLLRLIEIVEEETEHIEQLSAELEELEEQFHEQMKGRCPLCQQTINR